MNSFVSGVLPNLVKSLLVILLSCFIVLQLCPPIAGNLHADTPIGTIYFIPLAIAIAVGLALNKFIDNIYTLLALGGFAFVVFHFGYEIHAHLSTLPK